MLKIFLKLIQIIFLIIWTLYFIIGISKHYTHYGVLDWIILITLILIPYLIIFFFNKKPDIIRKLHNKHENKNLKPDAPIESTNSDASLNTSEKMDFTQSQDGTKIKDTEAEGKLGKSSNLQYDEVPQDVLNAMRSAYTGQQATNDMRIIDESLAIMETTSDIDTFLSRYETAMRCVLTLEQAKKAGIPIALPDGFSQSLTSAKNNSLADVLYRSYQKEVKAISRLKTNNGKINRINKYQQKLT